MKLFLSLFDMDLLPLERKTESYASWWQVNSVHWSVTPYASRISTHGHVPGGLLGTHSGFSHAECFGVSLF